MALKLRIPTYFDSLITNMTMRIGANDIFKVKTQMKKLIFHAETGQDEPKSKLAKKPKTLSQTKTRKQIQTNPNEPRTWKQNRYVQTNPKIRNIRKTRNQVDFARYTHGENCWGKFSIKI